MIQFPPVVTIISKWHEIMSQAQIYRFLQQFNFFYYFSLRLTKINKKQIKAIKANFFKLRLNSEIGWPWANYEGVSFLVPHLSASFHPCWGTCLDRLTLPVRGGNKIIVELMDNNICYIINVMDNEKKCLTSTSSNSWNWFKWDLIFSSMEMSFDAIICSLNRYSSSSQSSSSFSHFSDINWLWN